MNALRQFARGPSAGAERCELCAAPLAETHRHLLDRQPAKLVCCCDPCSILFSHDAGRYRRVDRTVQPLPWRLSDEGWNRLRLPVDLALFVNGLVYYPAASGMIYDEPSVNAWSALAEAWPEISSMQAEVEALLLHRVRTARDAAIVSLDLGYALMGLLRRHWEGFSGGSRVWDEVAAFFEKLRARP